MSMHAAAVVLKERLGHEGDGLAVLVGDVLDDVLVEHHVVGRAHQRAEFEIDFCLAAGGDFVVMALHLEAAALHGHRHLGAQVLVMIGGRHREVAFFEARAISQIVFRAARVPAALFRVNEIKTVLLTLVETDVIKNKKFRFGAEVGGIGQAGGGHIHFGFLGDVARVAVVALLGDRIDHVGHHHQRSYLGERIEHEPGGIGDQQHVAFVDRGPAANGGAIHAETFFKTGLAELLDGKRNVMPETGKISKAQVEHLDLVFLHELHDVFGSAHKNFSPLPAARRG